MNKVIPFVKKLHRFTPLDYSGLKGYFFMSKRTRTTKIEKWIKEGRGSGVGSEYKPWLKIQDVASKGRSTRLKGIKTNRQHEFLSDLERNYFYLTEYSDVVVDIREQFPLLPLEETIVIADELGIKHPTDPKTGEPITIYEITMFSEKQVRNILKTYQCH